MNKEKKNVCQPKIIQNYNHNMEGVDHHDWLLKNYSISIRSKKWYWCLFTRIVDMSLVNAYLLYKKVHPRNKLDLKDFRRKVARAYLKRGKDSRDIRRNWTRKPKVEEDLRYDLINHMIYLREEQRRCQYAKCTSKPRTYCKKCNVTLCVKCFASYHTRE